MHELLLSVVLPNYDHAYFLSRAIDAIAAQDGSLDEIIVVDDVSTDDSRDVLAQCQTRHPYLVVLCNERNFGELPDHALTDAGKKNRFGRTELRSCRNPSQRGISTPIVCRALINAAELDA